jgi:hypothetical protein
VSLVLEKNPKKINLKKISTRVVQKLARFGCVSIGVVYNLVGLMALLSVLGISDEDADEEGVMTIVENLPLGEVLLGGIILGLIGYIIWRIFEAITDPYEFGNHYKGLARRTGIGLSGIGYAIIAFGAAQILLGESGGDSEEDQQLLVSQVLEMPAGAWIVGAAGAITAFAGIVQFLFVAQKKYVRRVKFEKMSEGLKKTVHLLAWYGYIARGLLLLVIGYFILSAAILGDPQEVGDTDTAFDFIGEGWVGNILLSLVALGTMSYGFFMFIFARYYQFEKGD